MLLENLKNNTGIFINGYLITLQKKFFKDNPLDQNTSLAVSNAINYYFASFNTTFSICIKIFLNNVGLVNKP